jgi:hypothetical protein
MLVTSMHCQQFVHSFDQGRHNMDFWPFSSICVNTLIHLIIVFLQPFRLNQRIIFIVIAMISLSPVQHRGDVVHRLKLDTFTLSIQDETLNLHLSYKQELFLNNRLKFTGMWKCNKLLVHSIHIVCY